MASNRAGSGHGPRDGIDFAAVFATQPTAYLMMSPDLVIVEANEAYLRLLGRTREQLVGRYVFDAFPPSPEALDENGDNPLQLSFERARDTGQPDQMPLFHYDVLDQDTGELEHRAWSLISAPVLDAQGCTQLVLQRVEDVSAYVDERRRLAEIAEGRDSERLQLLEADLYARAQELRAALRAQETAARQLAGLAQVALQLASVESLAELTETVTGAGLAALHADGGAIGMVDDERGVVRITVADVLGRPVQERFAAVPRGSRLPASWVATTGQRLVLGNQETGLAWSADMAEVYELTGRRAWVGLPLYVGDRLRGSLVAGWVEERAFPDDELDLMEAFAAQCAQALDRLRALTAERQSAAASRALSEALQRSLLSPPPPVEHLEIAVRYRPASAGAEVGGDWYDAFLLANGDLTLVVGDVTGHDRTAAAAMAQIRNVLRGVAQTVGEPPAAVLTSLDRALDNLRVRSLATAILVQVRADDDTAGMAAYTVRWSNAGHPPPLLLLSDGTTTLLEHRPDLVLGVDPTARRGDHSVVVPVGATLLLYTDGLVERRDGDLDTGTERLRTTVASLATSTVEDLCDVLLDQLAAVPDDDVALLALRFGPPDPAT